MIKGTWTDAATIEARTAPLDRIKWLLWQGNALDAIEDIEDIECLADDVVGDLEENPTAASLRKLASALGELAASICCFRPEPVFSTATSINSFVATIPRLEGHSTPLLPPLLCDAPVPGPRDAAKPARRHA